MPVDKSTPDPVNATSAFATITGSPVVILTLLPLTITVASAAIVTLPTVKLNC